MAEKDQNDPKGSLNARMAPVVSNIYKLALTVGTIVDIYTKLTS